MAVERRDPIAIQGDVFLWREWKLNKQVNPRLQSIAAGEDFIWTGIVSESTCLANEGKPGGGIASEKHTTPVPQFDCTCGFWGYATLEDFLAATLGGLTVQPVIGLVRGFGGFVVHEFGMRVRYARPELLLIQPHHFARTPNVLARRLRKVYDCEVQIKDVQPFFTEQKALIDAGQPAGYPCIMPPVNLSTSTIPMTEIDAENISWDEVGKKVSDNPYLGKEQ